MIEKLGADILFAGEGEFLKNHVLIHENGRILNIDDRKNHADNEIHHFSGIICPGFVNTHCHLELSHMKGRIDSGTGLLPFLKTVVGYRNVEMEIIEDAIARGDEEMYDNGIVAVGDISNKLDTAVTKNNSGIAYHTFVEMFDFMQPAMTDATIAQYAPVYQDQASQGLNKKAVAPHAPYTVSPKLFEYIRKLNNGKDVTISIHNQETPHENNLFLNKGGDFLQFYQDFGFSLDHFSATGERAIHYAIKNMDKQARTLFVHNTTTLREDIEIAQAWNDQVYWATCANANLYIENQLPDYQVFLDAKAKMTIGTDSLSSNWQLSILEEIKTIKKYKSFVPLELLLRWATANGADALGYSDYFGRFKKGMSPGILQIDCLVNEQNVDIASASVIRLA